MTEPVHTTPAAAGGGGSKLGMAVGFVILFVFLVFSGALGLFGAEIQKMLNGFANGFRSFLQLGSTYAGVFLAIAAIFYFRKK